VTKVAQAARSPRACGNEGGYRSRAGSFDRSYTHGDNSAIIATDSMKNTVYLLGARGTRWIAPNRLRWHLADHFGENVSAGEHSDDQDRSIFMATDQRR